MPRYGALLGGAPSHSHAFRDAILAADTVPGVAAELGVMPIDVVVYTLALGDCENREVRRLLQVKST